MTTIDDIEVNFPACLAADFPRDLPLAERAVDRVLGAIDASASFGPLEDRSPGLRGNDWSNYLRCSEARMVHAAGAVRRHGVIGGRVLDYGAYFGNFSLLFRDLGFDVDAADAYASYAPALTPHLELLRQAGVRTLDFAETGRDLIGLPEGGYDVVLCMGVIEHVPHTPRVLLEPLNRVLKPGGLLVIDTPNLAYLYNRQKLARGKAVMTPLEIQYSAEIPFEGHHREYTVDEVLWMVHQLGHEALGAEIFNYSTYGYSVRSGRDATNHWRMMANPTMRELILVVSRKSSPGQHAHPLVEWKAVHQDVEQYWLNRIPPGVEVEDGAGVIKTELVLVQMEETRTHLVHELVVRDAMLVNAQEERNREVVARDVEISSLNERLSALQNAFDMTPSERFKRLWRRLTRRS